MYQTPAPIWNEIAATQRLQTPRWAELFQATDLETALQPLESELEAAGADARVSRAYLLVAPLLQENEAISRWIERTGRTDLRSSLPEVTTPSEAVMLASEEFRLTPSQQQQLTRLLKEGWTRPSSYAPSKPPNL